MSIVWSGTITKQAENFLGHHQILDNSLFLII